MVTLTQLAVDAHCCQGAQWELWCRLSLPLQGGLFTMAASFQEGVIKQQAAEGRSQKLPISEGLSLKALACRFNDMLLVKTATGPA